MVPWPIGNDEWAGSGRVVADPDLTPVCRFCSYFSMEGDTTGTSRSARLGSDFAVLRSYWLIRHVL